MGQGQVMAHKNGPNTSLFSLQVPCQFSVGNSDFLGIVSTPQQENFNGTLV